METNTIEFLSGLASGRNVDDAEKAFYISLLLLIALKNYIHRNVSSMFH